MRVRRSMLAVVVLSSMALLTAAFATSVLAQPGHVLPHNQALQPNLRKEPNVQHINGWTPSTKRVGANSAGGAQGAVTIMTEDFEGTFPSAGWSPYGTPNHWGTSACEQHTGMQSAWVEGTSGLACGSNYETNEEQSWIIYGPFSLSDATAARLSFSYWLSSEEGYDYLFLGSSIDGINFWGYSNSGYSSGWVDETFDITTTHVGQSNVWIAFLWNSDSDIVSSEGAFVDNLVLTKDLSKTNAVVGQKTVSRATAMGGDVLTYTISVLNNAMIDAALARLTDTLPANLSLVNGSLTASSGGLGIQGQMITWTGAINSSQTVLITYAARLADAIPLGTLVTNPLTIDDGTGVVFNTSATVKVGGSVFLPLVMKRWPPIPDMPTLNAISNAGSGNYAVTWNVAFLADTYILQEATNASFTSPTTVYAGSGTDWSASGKPTGTYYYRVKASNSYGDSGWSNTQSVQVIPPTTTAYIRNGTGGQLCYEVYGSGVGKKCSSSGLYFYGTFPAGTYSWHASARCGSMNGTQYYPPGTWTSDQFVCRSTTSIQTMPSGQDK
jgi:uncharacterized repeat protein (TIGR01451 family)